ncbi:TIGR02206 family membrane protein [Pseudobacillus sp. 179-B 2D1 NHS]|uniref:YwaF family protein n=1 Tax=Pseudobacillus sp. 179-B 2D1 NHS TaxID=3374292 RepID=UPI0038794728
MEWFSGSYKDVQFQMFSTSHITALIVLVGIVFSLFLFRDKLQRQNMRAIELTAAFFLIGIETAYHVWMLQTGTWTASRSLPLELCSFATFFTILLLITGKKIFYEILLFIGLLGASQALITPYLYFGFPHFRFFHFFCTHMLIFCTPLYFTWVKEYRPTFMSIVKTMIFLNILVPVISFINQLTKGNYLYLHHKPATASMLDLLGPYPWYILSLEAVAFVLSVIVWLLFRKKAATIVVKKDFQHYL